MGRNDYDHGGFFQRACGRCLLLLVALTLLCLGISILVLGQEASDKLQWAQTLRYNRTAYNVTSASCPAGVLVNNTDGSSSVTINGVYTMVEPKDAAAFFGSITVAVALTGLLSIAKRNDCGLFTYSYLLLLLLGGMSWLAVFCSVAHERASSFVDHYWNLYRLAHKDLGCPQLAGNDVVSDWVATGGTAGGAVVMHDMLDTTEKVANAAIVACVLLAFAIFGAVHALASADDAVVNMVRGSSGILALFGTLLIAAVSWSQARNEQWPDQYAGAWAQSVVGILGATLLVAGCCGCCGVKRLSRRCLAINVCSLLAFALVCIVVTILTFSLAKDDTVHFRREERVIGPEAQAALMRNVNVVAISSAVLTMVVVANLCVSLWLFRNVDVVAARQAEDAEERRLWARASSDRAFGTDGNATDDDDDIEIELGGAIVPGSRPRFDDDDDDDGGFV